MALSTPRSSSSPGRRTKPGTASSVQDSLARSPVVRLCDQKTKPSVRRKHPTSAAARDSQLSVAACPRIQRSRTEEHQEPFGGSRWALRILRADRTSQPQHRRQVALKLDPRAGACLGRLVGTSTRSLCALAASRSSGP
jgi:hypothetical protein